MRFDLIKVLFAGLVSMAIDQIVHQDETVRIQARTRSTAVPCPECGWRTRRVHAYHVRRLADLPVGGRGVVLELRVRRLACRNSGCPRRTFREQMPRLAARWGRRTHRLASLIADTGVSVAGRAGAVMLCRFGVRVSRSTVLRQVMALPIPLPPASTVVSVDDFALRRGRRYATLIIDPVTHRRIDVLPDRKAATLADWLRHHPGIDVVCRDGSAAYAEAIRQGAPDAVQVSDRWHLWHGLAAAVEKTVIAPSTCWHAGPPRTTLARQQRTRERHAAVHTLLDQGLGLLACARRLGWALNTVKRYAGAATAEQLQRPAQYRATLVDPYHDHLRRRLTEEPDVAVTRLLAEIREQGYPGSANLLVRYLKQGRADAATTPPSPRRLVAWLMTRPTSLSRPQRRHLANLVGCCPPMSAVAARVREFADLLTDRRGHDLHAWMDTVDRDDLPALHAFCHGLRKDLPAVVAGLTLPYSNGPIEGTNTKVKLLKRQMYGRAGFPLLRHRILLA